MKEALASVVSPRIEQIVRCCEEMARCRQYKNDIGAFLGEMDWMQELSRLLHDTKEHP